MHLYPGNCDFFAAAEHNTCLPRERGGLSPRSRLCCISLFSRLRGHPLRLCDDDHPQGSSLARSADGLRGSMSRHPRLLSVGPLRQKTGLHVALPPIYFILPYPPARNSPARRPFCGRPAWFSICHGRASSGFCGAAAPATSSCSFLEATPARWRQRSSSAPGVWRFTRP